MQTQELNLRNLFGTRFRPEPSQRSVPRSRCLRAGCFLLAMAAGWATAAGATPKVDESAPDFTLRTLDDQPVALRTLTEQGPVVLIVLRGWPGYQCPLCTRQVQEYVTNAAEFAQRGARVLMVYPGPADGLKAHAGEFVHNKQWPANFHFVIDPAYAFTLQYGLRWEAPKETAYPSTFVLERGGRIRFAQVSKTHGGRVSATTALAELAK
jgi:peroxiredoxin Q/BCP